MTKMQLTIGRMMLIVFILSTCVSIYATSPNFAAVRTSGSPWARLTAMLAWSFAAALPTLWVGTVMRTPPDALLVRFAVGNGFLALLLSLASIFFIFIIALLVIATTILSIGWYQMSQRTEQGDRENIRRPLIGFVSYIVQIFMTLGLFFAMKPVLEGILR